jgi:hypothetical protein
MINLEGSSSVIILRRYSGIGLKVLRKTTKTLGEDSRYSAEF